MAKTDEVVTITRDEYEELQYNTDLLCALQAAGVDNWDGYSEAIRSVDAEEQCLQPRSVSCAGCLKEDTCVL